MGERLDFARFLPGRSVLAVRASRSWQSSYRRVPAAAADPPQRSDQPHVPDGMRELRPPRRLQVGHQVQLPAVVARWQRRHARQRGSPHPPSDRGIRCAGSIRRSLPHTMQQRPPTAARWASVATIDPVRCNDELRRRGFRARSLARRRSGVRFVRFSFQDLFEVSRREPQAAAGGARPDHSRGVRNVSPRPS